MWASSSFCVFTLNLIERKTSMKRFLTYLWQEDEGQDLVEYALLVVLVALAAVTAMSSLASNISSAFANASAKLTTTT
jgi:pilus assembly protein Flp/PilA